MQIFSSIYSQYYLTIDKLRITLIIIIIISHYYFNIIYIYIIDCLPFQFSKMAPSENVPNILFLQIIASTIYCIYAIPIKMMP